MIEKEIRDKAIPFWIRPLRSAYRFVKKHYRSGDDIKQINIAGIKYLVWANEDIGKKLLLTRSFEKAETRVFERLVQPGDVCLDIGGNIGYFALNLARLCKGRGRVYTFEPLSRNASMIALAAELNGFDNISIVRKAVSNVDGIITMTVPEEDGAYAYIDSEGPGQPGLSIDCTTLDSFVDNNQIAQVAAVKIDVEGAEKLVLEGASRLLNGAGSPRVVMIELVDDFLQRYGSSVSDVIDYMKKAGYRACYANHDGTLAAFSDGEINKIFNVFFIKD